MWGGQFTEDIKLPSQGAIFDIERQKYIWQKTSRDDCVGVGLFNNSNIIKIHIKRIVTLITLTILSYLWIWKKISIGNL